MSFIVEVKTNSNNGLPYRTLGKLLNKYDMELIESVDWVGLEKGTGKYIYSVQMHESVTPETELRGE